MDNDEKASTCFSRWGILPLTTSHNLSVRKSWMWLANLWEFIAYLCCWPTTHWEVAIFGSALVKDVHVAESMFLSISAQVVTFTFSLLGQHWLAGKVNCLIFTEEFKLSPPSLKASSTMGDFGDHLDETQSGPLSRGNAHDREQSLSNFQRCWGYGNWWLLQSLCVGKSFRPSKKV